MSNPHLHSVESCSEKSRPIKHGGQLHGLMIAIEYSYKLDSKKLFLFMVRTRPVIAQTVTFTCLLDDVIACNSNNNQTAAMDPYLSKHFKYMAACIIHIY